MTQAHRTQRGAWWLLLVLLVPTVWLAIRQLDLSVDIENDALKSPGSREAQALVERVEQFGRDVVIMAAFQALPVGSGTVTEVEAKELERLAAAVRALPGVKSLRNWPNTGSGARVWAIELHAEKGDYAGAVGAVEHLVREQCPAGLRPALSGQPLGELVIAEEVQAEQRTILPLVVGAFLALLFLYYRHAGLVLAILAPAGIGIVWTSGIYALLGRELDPISVMLQPVLLTVGVAAGVHWIEAYLDRLHDGLAPEVAAHAALADLIKPAMLSALTTVVGFLALAFNSIPAVIDFGVFAALGTALTYSIAGLATPALLTLFARRVGARLVERHGRTTGALGRRAADWVAARALAIRVGAVLVALGGLGLWTQISVDNDPERVLPAEHRFRRDTAALTSEIGGADVFDLLVPAGSKLADPVELALFAGYVLSRPEVAGAAGPPLLSKGGAWLVRFLIAPSGSSRREPLFEHIEARAAAFGAPDVRVTGLAVQIARDSGRLIRNAILGAATSFVTLFVIFWIGFRSLFYAVLAMIPNVLPCIVVYATLALFGRPLTVATAMIGSVLLGLIVDDTIHLLHRFREQRQRGVEPLAAVEHMFQHGGRALLVTSIVLGVGFAVGLCGSLSTTVEFCGLATATIATAFVSDAVVLPAILVSARVPEVGHG
ncbi:MAG: MMPL family transporter [Planctomycetes bacterium]|nr:MMPL family transporter [Planctomycetota bacterium]